MSDMSPMRLSGVRFSYGAAPVLDGLDLEVKPAEVTVLTGPNGRGKTTCLWLAAGLLKPKAGQVSVFGRAPFSDREVLGRVGFVAEGAPLPQGWTGSQLLSFQRQTFPRWDAPGVESLVSLLGVDLDKQVQELSRGQRGKLALLLALATQPELLLLDEPTLGLDVASRRIVTKAVLTRLVEGGCAVVLATHDIAVAERIGDRLVFLDGGRVGCDEPIPDLLERHRVLGWSGQGQVDAALEAVELPSVMGRRALARRWSPEAQRRWQDSGGDHEPADLETIYLSLTGEVQHAW